MSPILAIHICGGTVGLASGAAALSFRKGSRWHALAGKVFVASMLMMATGATFLAIQKHQSGNIVGGIFTFYLILTAWWTARHNNGGASKFGWAVVLIPLAVGVPVIAPPLLKDRPVGSAPAVTEKVGAGTPVAV